MKAALAVTRINAVVEEIDQMEAFKASMKIAPIAICIENSGTAIKHEIKPYHHCQFWGDKVYCWIWDARKLELVLDANDVNPADFTITTDFEDIPILYDDQVFSEEIWQPYIQQIPTIINTDLLNWSAELENKIEFDFFEDNCNYYKAIYDEIGNNGMLCFDEIESGEDGITPEGIIFKIFDKGKGKDWFEKKKEANNLKASMENEFYFHRIEKECSKDTTDDTQFVYGQHGEILAYPNEIRVPEDWVLWHPFLMNSRDANEYFFEKI